MEKTEEEATESNVRSWKAVGQLLNDLGVPRKLNSKLI